MSCVTEHDTGSPSDSLLESLWVTRFGGHLVLSEKGVYQGRDPRFSTDFRPPQECVSRRGEVDPLNWTADQRR